MHAEAPIARRLGFPVAVGGGSDRGAEAQARGLVSAGARGLVSFGLAGGLDASVRPGQVIIAREVWVEGTVLAADAALSARFGGSTGHRLYGASVPLLTLAEKADAARRYAAQAVDMESGAVARVAAEHGLPFAAVRAICDPADRAVPSVAMTALDDQGRIRIGPMLTQLLRHPGQIPALIGLGIEAGRARRGLIAVCSAFRG